MTGELSVLNCNAGDINISFDGSNPLEVERAKRIIEDMLRRGYALFVQVGEELKKVKRFDPKTCEYIIAAGADYGEAIDAQDEVTKTKRKATKSAKERRLSLTTSRATGVAPTAGG